MGHSNIPLLSWPMNNKIKLHGSETKSNIKYGFTTNSSMELNPTWRNHIFLHKLTHSSYKLGLKANISDSKNWLHTIEMNWLYSDCPAKYTPI